MGVKILLVSGLFATILVLVAAEGNDDGGHKIVLELSPKKEKRSHGDEHHSHGHKHDHQVVARVEHVGKFEHHHLHKHSHDHSGEIKSAPMKHFHAHSHDGQVGVDHKHHGDVAHNIDGAVKHGHKGAVDHAHKGGVDHAHKGGVGHSHDGKVGHLHDGNVGHKHHGDVGHGHKGDIGHGHQGSVSHSHGGHTNHAHGGHTSHSHDGQVSHSHGGHTNHAHAGNIGHSHQGQTTHGHGGNLVYAQQGKASKRERLSESPKDTIEDFSPYSVQESDHEGAADSSEGSRKFSFQAYPIDAGVDYVPSPSQQGQQSNSLQETKPYVPSSTSGGEIDPFTKALREQSQQLDAILSKLFGAEFIARQSAVKEGDGEKNQKKELENPGY